MPEDTKIFENFVSFEEFQPLICFSAGLCYGTTIHFDMNGIEYISGTDRTVATSSLWINADYWSVYHTGKLKFDSETIDREKMKSFDALISGKKFSGLTDCKDSQEVKIAFDDIEIVIDKPGDEIYDLVNFYLPDGRIYYYSDALYESNEIDEERRSLWLTIWALMIYDKYRLQLLYEQYSGNDYPNVPLDYYRNQKLDLICSQKLGRKAHV
jgi:hypothetical protein